MAVSLKCRMLPSLFPSIDGQLLQILTSKTLRVWNSILVYWCYRCEVFGQSRDHLLLHSYLSAILTFHFQFFGYMLDSKLVNARAFLPALTCPKGFKRSSSLFHALHSKGTK